MGNNIASVGLSEPNTEWSEKFKKAREEIHAACGKVSSIEHIGSTSIPNLLAKPEIDILVGVNKLEDIEECTHSLKKAGYEYYQKFETVVPERRYFRKSDGITPLVHVHAYKAESEIYKDHLLFRDYMKMHPEAVKEYEELKRRLVQESKGDRGVYQDGKVEFTQRIIKQAKAV